MKNCSNSLAEPLSIIFKLVYNTGILPSQWRLANVVPVFKKGEKNDVQNYRPISLTCLITKVMERIVYDELLHLTLNKIDSRQHGFLNNKSCSTNMISFVESIISTFNEKNPTDIIYFDFAKAFDSVNKMKFHPKKCKALTVNCPSSDRFILLNLPFMSVLYKLGHSILDNTECERDLGVHVNSSFDWNEHQELILNKAHQMLGLVKRPCHFVLDPRKRRSIYITLIRSLFEHCSQIWRPVKNCDEIKFEALQKKAITWIFNEDFIRYSIDKYFSKCKQIDIPPLQLHFELNDLMFFYKIVRELIPVSLPNYIVPYMGTSTLRSRHLDPLCYVYAADKRIPTTSPFFKSYFYRTAHLWNSLPIDIREIQSMIPFKLAARAFLWDKYSNLMT